MSHPTRIFTLPLRPQISKNILVASQSSRPVCPFSTTSSHSFPRARNSDRGISPLRRTGLKRQKLTVAKFPLPKPVLSNYAAQPETDKNHGLYGFFNAKKDRVSNPIDEMAYSRPWTLPELRGKSWEDLHSLWWVCSRDLNRISTSLHEHKRLELGFGGKDFETRMAHVKRTQKFIKWALTERWHAYNDARSLAVNDPSVDLAAEEGSAYNPDMEEDARLLEEPEEGLAHGDRKI